MKNKILKILVVLLFAGLYIDVKMMPKDDSICVSTARQRTFNVQVIIPFKPRRETFYFGIGNRHYDHQRRTTYYFDEERVDDVGLPIVLGVNTHDSGCSVRLKDRIRRGGYGFFGRHAHYINLRPFSEIQEYGVIDWDIEERYITKERYDEWYNY